MRELDHVIHGLGCVIIGRNEEERLRDCLDSVLPSCAACVYVDSGSSDGSVALAESLGVPVIELDASRPFSAARARNAGARFLRETGTPIELIQFVDGDCKIADGWMFAGAEAMRRDPGLAVVFGGARERDPERSIYNRLAQIEWNVPIGDARACGGVAIMRVETFESVGRFDETLIAGEEPELCLRFRNAGHRIERIEPEMMVHDLAMTRFGQWWNRTKRSGYAVAHAAHKHSKDPSRYRVAESRRILLWGAVLPVISFGAAIPTFGLSLMLLLGYARPALGLYRYARSRGGSAPDARMYAILCTLGKFPEFLGLLRYTADRLLHRQGRIIEHK